MNLFSFSMMAIVAMLLSPRLTAQSSSDSSPTPSAQQLYIDVHYIGPGKVDAKAVAAAHAKDLAVEHKYGVQFIQYWVDEVYGRVYCLSSAPDTLSIRKTHQEAHGLMPVKVYRMTDGPEAAVQKGKSFFLDVHELGAGKVTAKDVAGAHQKDLAVQGKYGVNFINYWVNEQNGVVMCLSQAKDSAAVINTHKEAHGLLPAHIMQVKPGN